MNTENVIEYNTKAKLALLCNTKLKIYARKKLSKCLKGSRMTPLIKAFINESFNTPRYAILLAIVFGKEFEELRERNLRGEYSFEHISHEGYWERGVNKLELPVAIFFSYKFSVEVHPEVTSILRRLEIELQNNSESDPLDFIDKEINPLH